MSQWVVNESYDSVEIIKTPGNPQTVTKCQNIIIKPITRIFSLSTNQYNL